MKKTKGYWRNRFTSREVYLWTTNKWNTINQRTVNGAYSQCPSIRFNPQQQSYLAKGILIDMTKDEFFDWCASNENKIREMMLNCERPSIDRICDECSYSLENIHIIPLISNMRKNTSVIDVYPRNKEEYTLRNRLQYITSHSSYNYKELVIDYYLKNYPLKFILEVVNLIDNPHSLVTPETIVNSDVVKILEDKVADEKIADELELKLLEQRRARTEARHARQSAEEKRKADKKWAKSCPEYDEFTREYNKIRPLLVLKGLTVQKEVIRALKEKYNRN